jgi:hypothetical protein
MNLVWKTVLMAGTALLGANGGVQAADLLLEQDRYESVRPYTAERWREPSYEARDERYRHRFVDRDEDDVDLVPPRPIEGRRFEERRYGSFDHGRRDERYVIERDDWHRRVVSQPRWRDDDCRIVITRTIKPWGETVERRKTVCD